MGLFSELGSIAGDFLGGPIGGSIGSALGGALDSSSAQKQGDQRIREANEWEERLSNTAYQRAMADMRQAGLNPILASKLGGATTPSIQSSPILAPAMQTANAAVQNARTSAKQTQSNVELQEEQKKKIEAEIDKVAAEITQIKFQSEKILHEITNLKNHTILLSQDYLLRKEQTGVSEADKWFKQQLITQIKKLGGDESSALGAALRILTLLKGN